MNASATIRATYIRQARMSMAPQLGFPTNSMEKRVALQPRPAMDEKLKTFIAVNHIEHRSKCNEERVAQLDEERNEDSNEVYTKNSYLDNKSFMYLEETHASVRIRLKTMFTVFPYRDPIYLVAIIFLIGSIDLVINAFFDLLPRTVPSTEFETVETVAIPTTVLIGSILFFAAGIFDTFGALNADRGSIEMSKSEPGEMVFRPALLGTPEFKWLPSYTKLRDLTTTNLAFQAGLIVLFGGVVFMFAGVVDFPGLIPEDSPFFASIVFGPQVMHGFLFLIANLMLAVSEQERWWKPKICDPDWLGAFLNAVGGAGLMMAGVFLFERDDVVNGEVKAAVAAMIGSWAFLLGGVVRWYVVMEVW